MNPSEIRARLHASPFTPFRVHLSDGKAYEVPHPEQALLTSSTLYVAVGEATTENEKFPARAVQCSLLHVTALEDVKAA